MKIAEAPANHILIAYYNVDVEGVTMCHHTFVHPLNTKPYNGQLTHIYESYPSMFHLHLYFLPP